MYERHFGLRERPFTLAPDPDFLYRGGQYRGALTLLEYTLESQAGFTLVTGDVGCGKTTLIRHLLREQAAPVTVGLITNTHASFGRIAQWVNLAFGLEYQRRDDVELHQQFTELLLEEYARGRRVVLVVDEAQNLTPDALEQLRVLSNINADKHSVFQLVLVGQPELRATLRRADLRQFAQRIGVSFHLRPLERDDVHAYVRHRLGVAGGSPELFAPDAIDAIHGAALGVPRVINLVGDAALVYAFADGRRSIELDIVTAVLADRDAGWSAGGSGLVDAPASG